MVQSRKSDAHVCWQVELALGVAHGCLSHDETVVCAAYNALQNSA